MRHGFAALGTLLLLAAPAVGDPTTLLVLESESSITLAEGGGSTPLSGWLTVEVGALPPPGTTPFDLIAIFVSAGTDLEIRLDPDVLSPGLGVLNAQGDFLIPTLLVTVASPPADPFDLGLQNVMGTAHWDALRQVLSH